MTRENAEFWIPTTAEVQEEMQRVKRQDRFSRTLWSTLGTVIVVVAVAIVIAGAIYGESVSRTIFSNGINFFTISAVSRPDFLNVTTPPIPK